MRRTFYIESINPEIQQIETEDFTVVEYIDWYYEDKIDKIRDEGNTHDVGTIFAYWSQKSNKKNKVPIVLREFMAILFATFIMNSKENVGLDSLKKITQFIIERKSESSNKNKMMEDEDENEDFSKKNEVNSKTCIDTLLKIITVGLDKSYDDFIQDVNNIVKEIIKISSDYSTFSDAEARTITHYRSCLKSNYSIKYSKNLGLISKNCKIYDMFYKKFKSIEEKYFRHLYKEENKAVRNNIFKTYRMKIILIDDQKVIGNFLEDIRLFYEERINQEEFDSNYEDYWSQFIDKKEDFDLNYLLYIAPFNVEFPKEKEKSVEQNNFLTEFLSRNDHIYRYLMYLPWGLSKESEFISIEKDLKSEENSNQSNYDVLYSYLYEPLNIYTRDSEHVYDVKLYKISLKKGSDVIFCKLFCKNVEINFTSKTQENKSKTSPSTNNGTITMECVDFLGVHHKDESGMNEKTTATFGDSTIKIFNLFSTKDAPFCYSTTSNNGWLEVFVSLTDKKTINTSDIPVDYFKSIVMPQFEIESSFKNYKITSMEIKPENDVRFTFKVDEVNETRLNITDYYDVTSIKIEQFIVGKNQHLSMPVATFMPIQ